MRAGRRTLALATVGCALAAGGGAAFAATQHHAASHPAKVRPAARPAAQHPCPHMGMDTGGAASSNV